MEKTFVYKQIAEELIQDILNRKLAPGDRLPSIRQQTERWQCTPGTIQRAYAELAAQGLVHSQAGKGTHVVGHPEPSTLQKSASLRRASMVHRAESFLLESITAGFTPQEIIDSIQLAMDRWRTIETHQASQAEIPTINFAGSHDLAMIWISNSMDEILPGNNLQIKFNGSLNGLMMLAEGKCDLAGCHLWDQETASYNESHVRKLFPGKKMLIVRLADRNIGLMVSPNNPHDIHTLTDLTREELRFINRQFGSGTRVWLDETLHQMGINPSSIHGYENEKSTHTDIARAIAEGKADVGIGLESAARAFHLGFIPLVEESYDLVCELKTSEGPAGLLFDWLASNDGKKKIANIPGYDTAHSGAQKILVL